MNYVNTATAESVALQIIYIVDTWIFLSISSLINYQYALLHRKLKSSSFYFQIMGFVIEGRNGNNGRRRPNSAEYKKLSTNVEEAMPSLDQSTATKNFIY